MIRKMGKELPLSPDTPAILGMDFAGTVEAVGDGVRGYSVGDEVYGCAGGLADLPGTLAEYISADSNLIAHKPKNLSMRESAALPLVAITAYEGLTRAGIKEGLKVLVHGGRVGKRLARWSLKADSPRHRRRDFKAGVVGSSAQQDPTACSDLQQYCQPLGRSADLLTLAAHCCPVPGRVERKCARSVPRRRERSDPLPPSRMTAPQDTKLLFVLAPLADGREDNRPL